MNRGDIYWVSLDPTKGREQQGNRPVLIVSASAFNQATKLPIVCPITNHGAFARRLGFSVALEGCKTSGIVRCDQPRVLDLAQRNGQKVESVSKEIMEDVLAKITVLFE